MKQLYDTERHGNLRSKSYSPRTVDEILKLDEKLENVLGDIADLTEKQNSYNLIQAESVGATLRWALVRASTL